jgi:hypothetical protein
MLPNRAGVALATVAQVKSNQKKQTKLLRKKKNSCIIESYSSKWEITPFIFRFTTKEEIMKTRRILTLSFTILFPILLIIGLASCIGVPPLTAEYSHQGRLLTSAGVPVPDGDYSIRYRLFHEATGTTTAVYTETKTVAIKGGLFDTSVGLTGDVKPEVFSQPTWMEITVNGEKLTPLQRLEGAPYASSLVAGAVIQGYVPITRTFSSYTDLGAALTVWNEDSSTKGGNGLSVFNSASATGADRYKVAALQAVAADADVTASTGGYAAMFRSDNFRGTYTKAGPSWFAAVFDSDVGISLTGGGSCTGCALAYVAQNNGVEVIQAGDFVAAEGVVVDPDLNVPVLQVYKATSATDPIIGVATGAMVRNPVEDFQGTTTGGYDGQDGPAANGQYLNVIVQGLVQVKLSQPAALQIGDWITVESSQTMTAIGDAPRVARLMSAVDENGMAWIMFNGQ